MMPGMTMHAVSSALMSYDVYSADDERERQGRGWDWPGLAMDATGHGMGPLSLAPAAVMPCHHAAMPSSGQLARPVLANPGKSTLHCRLAAAQDAAGHAPAWPHGRTRGTSHARLIGGLARAVPVHSVCGSFQGRGSTSSKAPAALVNKLRL